MSFETDSFFPNRLAERAKLTYLDVISFIVAHKEQYGFFRKSSSILEFFVLKYFPVKPP